jgi:hypothetical protein
MVHSSMLTINASGELLTRGDFFLGESVPFGSLEFIADYFGHLSFSPKGSDSGTVFIRMTRGGSPSLRTILEDSTDEFYMASSGEGSSGLPLPWRHSMGTPPSPITTMPWLEDAPIRQTMMTILLCTVLSRPDIGLLPE